MDELGIDSADIGLPGASRAGAREIVALAKETDEAARLRPNMAHPHASQRRRAPRSERRTRPGWRSKLRVHRLVAIRRFAEDWTLDTMLKSVETSVAARVKAGLPVMFVTEDTTRADPETLAEALRDRDRCRRQADLRLGYRGPRDPPRACATCSRFVESDVDR